MKYVVALIVGLVGTVVLTAPAEAHTVSRVTLVAPSVHQVGQSVVVAGKVRGKSHVVRIQQRKAGRWVLVRKARVRHGAYQARLRPTASTTTLRAVAAGETSRTVTTSSSRVAAMATLPAGACGTQVLKPDGTPWACTFRDEFNGWSLNRANWLPQASQFAMGTQAAHACFVDNPSYVRVANGSLNLTVRKVATPVTCTFGGMSGPTNYVSGGVSSYRLFSQQYGRFEARFKNTATTYPGLQEAFWMWPDDRYPSTVKWPFAGEIDVAETYSKYPDLNVPFLHYSADQFGNLVGTNTAWNCTAFRGQWNTYTLEWTATKLEVFVNGKSCLVNTSGDAAFRKAYIVNFSQGLGQGLNTYDGRAPLPATMSVDYVRVWK